MMCNKHAFLFFFLGAIFMLALCTMAHAADALPNHALTPGAINPKVTQANIRQTICVPGYTKTIRPPVTYTNALKKKQIVQYKYTDRVLSHYEEDHAIALTIGGHPRDPKNLWPEPLASAKKKDRLEVRLNKLVCNGTITLKTAQREMAKNWLNAYNKYVSSPLK